MSHIVQTCTLRHHISVLVGISDEKAEEQWAREYEAADSSFVVGEVEVNSRFVEVAKVVGAKQRACNTQSENHEVDDEVEEASGPTCWVAVVVRMSGDVDDDCGNPVPSRFYCCFQCTSDVLSNSP
jgi:hypothetical protein